MENPVVISVASILYRDFYYRYWYVWSVLW